MASVSILRKSLSTMLDSLLSLLQLKIALWGTQYKRYPQPFSFIINVISWAVNAVLFIPYAVRFIVSHLFDQFCSAVTDLFHKLAQAPQESVFDGINFPEMIRGTGILPMFTQFLPMATQLSIKDDIIHFYSHLLRSFRSLSPSPLMATLSIIFFKPLQIIGGLLFLPWCLASHIANDIVKAVSQLGLCVMTSIKVLNLLIVNAPLLIKDACAPSNYPEPNDMLNGMNVLSALGAGLQAEIPAAEMSQGSRAFMAQDVDPYANNSSNFTL
jgi:hypothetical protein